MTKNCRNICDFRNAYEKSVEVSLGLMFSIAVVGLLVIAITALDRIFVRPISQPMQVSVGTNMTACWVYPTYYETNSAHIENVFRMPTTNYNGAVIFGRKPGDLEWIQEGIRFGGLLTQNVSITIYREIRLLIIPPDRAEWRISP